MHMVITDFAGLDNTPGGAALYGGAEGRHWSRASLQNAVGPRFRSIAAACRKDGEIALQRTTSTPPAISPSFRLAATRLETDGSTYFVGKLLKLACVGECSAILQ